MLPPTERYGGLDLTSLSPCFVCEDGHCGQPVKAGASCQAIANHLLGNFEILALRPPRRGEWLTKSNKCGNASSRFTTHWMSRKMNPSIPADRVVARTSQQILVP